MPAIQPGSLVLVTGASGFIAAHLVSLLLEKGYKVRGTVRSTEKGEYLKNLFEGEGKKGFEYVIVKDIADASSFDEAVKGVQGIAHTASPFHFDAEDPDELIKPAVQGTLGVLKSALKNNSDLSRVVITSSVASVMSPTPSSKRSTKAPETKNFPPGPHVYDENDWNDYSPDVIEKEGAKAPAGDKYRASKVLAEKAGWDFVEEKKPKWDFAVINPPLVLGPVIHQCEKAENLNTSVAQFWAYCQGKKTDDDLKTSTGNWVDVRDVAKAHFQALVVEEAGGNRFITSAGAFNGQQIVDYLHTLPDDPIPKGPFGQKGTGDKINAGSNKFDGSKATKVLDINYIDFDECLGDMLKSLKSRYQL